MFGIWLVLKLRKLRTSALNYRKTNNSCFVVVELPYQARIYQIHQTAEHTVVHIFKKVQNAITKKKLNLKVPTATVE